MLLALQVFLERRIRGASVAAHAVYHDEGVLQGSNWAV